MWRRWIALGCLAAGLAAAGPAPARGSGGEEDAAVLTHEARTEGLSGLNLWLARLYNGDKWVFAAVVTVTMALMGALIAVVVDFVLKRLGLDVKRMAHRE